MLELGQRQLPVLVLVVKLEDMLNLLVADVLSQLRERVLQILRSNHIVVVHVERFENGLDAGLRQILPDVDGGGDEL